MLVSLACCCWYWRDVPVEKPDRRVYSDAGVHKHAAIESRVHSLRSKDPMELDAFSDRLIITSCAPLACSTSAGCMVMHGCSGQSRVA